MQAITGIELIFVDHFKPYRIDAKGNRFELPHAVFVGVVPIVAGVVVGLEWSQLVAGNAAGFIAVFAVMASVLTAIMPMISGLVGQLDPERIRELKTGSLTSDENREAAEVLVAKSEIIRSLFAAVAWAVTILCVSLLPLVIICHSAFQTDIRVASPVNLTVIMSIFRQALAFLIGFAGATSLIAFIQIVSGIHLLVRHGQAEVEKELSELSRRYNP